MAKKYLIVEDDDKSFEGCLTICIGIGAFFAVVYVILSYAHFLLGALLGFLGFVAGKYIIDSNPIYKKRHKTGIYLATMLLLGGFGFWVGTQVSTKFKKDIETPPEKSQPAETNPRPNQQESEPTPRNSQKQAITEKKQVNTDSTKDLPGEGQNPQSSSPILKDGTNIYQAPTINNEEQSPELNPKAP